MSKMPKNSWVMIDRTQFNLEDIKIKNINNKRGYLYVELDRDELKNRLDEHHFNYLLDCFGNKTLISFEHNLEKDEWDYDTYQKLKELEG